MSFYDAIRVGASGAADDFTIERSLRFESGTSDKLTRTFGTNTSNTTKTIAFWLKRAKLGSFMSMFSTAVNGFVEGRVQFTNDDKLQYTDRDSSSGSTDIQKITTRKFRDTHAWYHIVVAIDTTNSTADDRVKIYVNGVQETDFSSSTNPSQNYATSFFRSSADNYIGVNNNSSDFFSGYLTEITFIDGQALTPTSFGEFDSTTGQWNPIDTSGLTYGTNGFRLNFEDNSSTTASTQGKDISGNDNNFTPNGFGATNVDAVKDTPTNNFCTLSSITDSGAVFGSGVLSEGSLRYTGGSSNRTIASTFGIRHTDTQGYYFEARILTGNEANRLFVGIGYTSTNWINTDARGANADSWVLRNGDGVFIHNSSVDGETSGAGALSIGDIIQIAVKENKIWVGKNNTYFFSGNPATGANPKFSDIASTWTPVADVMTSNQVQFNFGQDSSFSNYVTAQGNTDGNGHGDFYYTPPTGFLALCSKNLPDPTIKLPNQYFNTLLYTGDDSNDRDITGVGFQPDWLWIKNREGPDWNMLQDAVRGANEVLYSNRTEGAVTDNTNGHVNSFLADGFNVTAGASGNVNENNEDYAAWNWNAGGSTVTNNNGSISSQVRANTTAGFSIITWTGTGSNLTIGHGLGVKPSAHITKARTGSSGCPWFVYFSILGANNNLRLNTTAAVNSGSGQSDLYNDTEPTSSVITIGDSSCINENGGTYVTYAFAEVAGYSKFGKYTGNGNSNGTFVFTGFKPAWVMVKNKDSAYSWDINDNKRDPSNVCDKVLSANLADAEATATSMDFLSNGFKLRVNNNSQNRSGDTFVFFAFAERPFKNARAR